MTSIAPVAVAALVKMLYASALAGISVAVVFSLAVLGVTRSNEMRRAHRARAATAYAALALIGLAIAAGIVVYGLVLITRKS